MINLKNISPDNFLRTYDVNKLNNISKQKLVSFGEDYVDLSTKNDSVENKPKRSTASKIGTAIASLCITGLGQLSKGETGKAAAMFFGTLAAGIIAYAIVPVLLPVIGIGMAVYSAYDAYKD